MKKEITIKPIYAILIVLVIVYICYSLFGQYQKSSSVSAERDTLNAKLKSLSIEHNRLKRVYDSKKNQISLVIEQRDRSRQDLQKATQETAKAKSELKSLKRKIYLS